ncbi:hypothetical protein [Aestuariibius sp. HNIBRBA575]|uniref:hypothetical protein n=1 Tax=Aestuariibius sp. HNIBRBA575 TaxID=3233343 RepID=UPI0034A56CB3
MRFFVLALGLAVSGCVDVATSPVEVAASVQAGAPQAHYETFPAALFAGMSYSCSEPGQTLVRPNANEIRCESYLEPDATAGAILEFNGTVDNLPKFVLSLISQPASSGYVVTADTYLRVPNPNGQVAKVRFEDREVTQDLHELFELTGGRPL